MKKVLCGVLGVVALLGGISAPAGAAEDRFQAGREAARAGDLVRLNRLIQEAGDSPLDGYLSYWALSIRLARHENVDADYASFLAREDGSLLAERARADWIRASARSGRWDIVRSQAPLLRQPEQEMNCWLWQAKIAAGSPSIASDADSLWNSTNEPGEACAPVIAALSVLKTADAHWQRARRLLEVQHFAAARATLARLPAGEAPQAQQIAEALENPLLFLSRNHPPVDRPSRETLVLALSRLAQIDYRGAAARLEVLGPVMPAPDRGYLAGVIGWQSARANQPDALTWYHDAGKAEQSAESRTWHVRSALRAQAWGDVRQAIDMMSPDQRALPEWTYWHGRAQKELGRTREAQDDFTRIAGQPSFYGMLAGEELGHPFTAPRAAAPASREELARVENDRSIRRSLTLLRIGSRVDGVREWNWAVRDVNDRFLLAAAEIARREQLYDRAIYSAEKTRTEHDFGLRYLLPYYDTVEPASRRWGLDVYWVYGLMRQESRFISVARSSVGAQGLMQVMPATAKFVAEKIGMPFSADQVKETGTNVTLGTAYLRMMMDRLDNQMALASAAYNAGPGRILRWRTDQPVEGAVFAETIPIAETRDYVKKVLANTVAYAALLTGKPQSLKSRLGVVQSALSPNAPADLTRLPAADGAGLAQ